MKFLLTALSVLFLGNHLLTAKVSHLLVSSLGEGVVRMDQVHEDKVVPPSTFLPKEVSLHVKPKSGIETLAAGYLFRFGASTSFQCQDDSLEILSGSLLMRSRKITNKIEIIGPEVSLIVSGTGTSLIQAEPNGGLKCVGLLGSLKFRLKNGVESNLLPGELVFTDLKKMSFSDKVNIELQNLLESSFLVSGFMNSSSFESALQNVADLQQNTITKSYNAKVGRAKSASNFELISSPSKNTSPPPSPRFFIKENYELPEKSPLNELLGRAPKSFRGTSRISNNPSVIPKPAAVEEKRPFPSRLLRGQ
jgi:hypothetical protein